MLVNLNQTEASVVILVGNRLDACGLSGSRITVQQTVVGFLPAHKGLRIVDQLLLCKLVADQVIQFYMCDIGNRNNLRSVVCMSDSECLVQAQFSDSEFPVKYRDRLFKLFCIHRCLQMTAELCDPVSDPLVEQFSRISGLLIVQQRVHAVHGKIAAEHRKVKVKQLFHDGKIVPRHLVDGAFYLPADLARPAVCILIVHKQKSQEIVPEISGKSVADRKLHQFFEAFIE